VTSGSTQIWDASALHAAAVADRLDVLGDMACCAALGSPRNVTTAAVVDELRRNGLRVAEQSWLAVEHVDGLDEITAVVKWAALVGSTSQHNRGEATVCAWADVHHAIAIMDDRGARRAAQANGLIAHGSLWLISSAVRVGQITETAASGFTNTLLNAGARYPFQHDGFPFWARQQRLL
jgi:predicted nucleic acid-binding protein